MRAARAPGARGVGVHVRERVSLSLPRQLGQTARVRVDPRVPKSTPTVCVPYMPREYQQSTLRVPLEPSEKLLRACSTALASTKVFRSMQPRVPSEYPVDYPLGTP